METKQTTKRAYEDFRYWTDRKTGRPVLYSVIYRENRGVHYDTYHKHPIYKFDNKFKLRILVVFGNLVRYSLRSVAKIVGISEVEARKFLQLPTVKHDETIGWDDELFEQRRIEKSSYLFCAKRVIDQELVKKLLAHYKPELLEYFSIISKAFDEYELDTKNNLEKMMITNHNGFVQFSHKFLSKNIHKEKISQ
jgi:hypothetical protein